MDIVNIGEFTNYCQERASDEALRSVVELAEKWTGFSERLQGAYGGHGQGMDEWINEAFRRLQDDGEEMTSDQLKQIREILVRFWKHGEAFEKWFHSKVILLDNPTPVTS